VEPAAIEAEIDLCVVRSGSEAAELIHDLDPLVIEGPATTPAELFEDDLILALPERPCGARADCPHRPPEVREEVPAPARENPFAALAVLRDGDAEDDETD
jgi:uncharacterized metal-binding protein YceD (DUF177 family)